MRQIIFLLLLASIFFGFGPAFAEKPDWPTQNGQPVMANFGAKVISTATIILSPGVITNIGQYIPSGTIGFTMDIWDSDVLIGHYSNLATAPVKWTGYRIASGTQNLKYDNAAGKTIKLWGCPNSTSTATIKLGIAFGNWEDRP